MNIVLIIAIIIVLACAIKGHHDGFIKTIVSICSVILTITVTTMIAPHISKMVQSNDALMESVSNQVASTLSLEENKTLNKADSIEEIEKLDLPKSLKEGLIENNNPEVYKTLLVDTFSGYISRYLAVIIVNAIVYIVVFLVFMIAFAILTRVLDLISKLPIINGLNKTAGLLIGILQGFIILWILCIFFTAIGSTPIGKTVFISINESPLLSAIYNNNLLLKVVTNIAKVLF